MTHDPWNGEDVYAPDDTVPEVTRLLLAAGVVAMCTGALLAGAILTGVDYLWRMRKVTRGR